VSHCLFISDCHLCDSRPHINQAFIEFLKNTAQSAQALYILGDFFEYWPGDDAIETGFQQPIIQALKSLSAAGTQVFFMHGNRDFLLGNTFATAIDAIFYQTLALLHCLANPFY
jgi:UDP-2,3-diacylglucosamine hydrolase